MTDLLCALCRGRSCLPQMLQALRRTEEDTIAAGLVDNVCEYCEAVVERQLSLAAADRFYRDLMVYQWRLSALEVQVRSVSAAIEDAAVSPTGESDVTFILQRCLNELEEAHKEAVAALEERASNYGIGNPTKSTGHIKRFAAGEVERQMAIDHYRKLASDTFSELMREASIMGQVKPDEAGLQSYKQVLERRMSFWQSQLEESWVAWEAVTARMHETGDQAVAAWKGVMTNLEAVQQCLRKGAFTASLQQALVVFAARGLQVELINSLGLTGLSCDPDVESTHSMTTVTMESTHSLNNPGTSDIFSQEVRVRSLVSVFKLLKEAGCLHEVGHALGEALQDLRDQTGVSEIISRSESSLMPTPHAKAAVQQAGSYRTWTKSQNSLSAVCSEELATPTRLISAAAAGTAATASGADCRTPSAHAAIHLAAVARMKPTAAVRQMSLAADDAEAEAKGAGCLIPWLTESLVEATRKAAEVGQAAQLINLVRLCQSLGNDSLASAVYTAAKRHSGQRFWQKMETMEDEDTWLELLKLLKPLSEDLEEPDWQKIETMENEDTSLELLKLPKPLSEDLEEEDDIVLVLPPRSKSLFSTELLQI